MLFTSNLPTCLLALASTSFAATIPRGRKILPRDQDCYKQWDKPDCWAPGFDINTDHHQKWPSTGKTVTYNLELTRTTMAVDGFERPMDVFNGQYPGPTLYADWGDTFEITVKNSLPDNGTSIHWHGLRQLNTNQFDGTNGLTECPIPPGSSKTYTFKATQYGSSWYHSHTSVQYSDGALGTIVIKGPTTADYDIDLGSYTLNDWFHTEAFALEEIAAHANGPPTAQSMLINGTTKNSFGGKYAETTLEPGKKHLLRLVNVGTNNWQHVSLDGHSFTVIAADFNPITPYTTSTLSLGIGQRYDVIIEANQKVDNYWFHSGFGGGQCDGPNENPNSQAIFRYQGSSGGDPTANNSTALPTGCYDETNIVPYHSVDVPSGNPEDLAVSFDQSQAQGNLVQWKVDGSSMVIDWEKPTLQYVLDGAYTNNSFPASDNVFVLDQANQWVYWVIEQPAGGPTNLPHPIHLHGHDFFVLAQGNGEFSDVSTLKLSNPIRRDTATLPGGGHLVLAFQTDNPGAWLMHCHIPFHISRGLGLQFLERPTEITGALGGLGELTQGCQVWDAYNNNAQFKQEDSGL